MPPSALRNWRVALAPGREPDDVGRAQRLQRARGRRVVRPVEKRLSHMRDIEQAGRGAGLQMFGEDARPVLDRHVVAGERRHARAEFDMQGVKRRLQHFSFVDMDHRRAVAGDRQAPTATRAADPGVAPSVR